MAAWLIKCLRYSISTQILPVYDSAARLVDGYAKARNELLFSVLTLNHSLANGCLKGAVEHGRCASISQKVCPFGCANEQVLCQCMAKTIVTGFTCTHLVIRVSEG